MNTVSIEIAGTVYRIRTDDDPEYVKKLANLVTVKILEVKRDTGASSVDCATMAALDFADRFMKEQEKKKPATRRKPSTDNGGEEPVFLL